MIEGMYICCNENGVIREFLDEPYRMMNGRGTLLRNAVRYDKKDAATRIAGGEELKLFWDISPMILDGRGTLTEEEAEKILGFIPTWEYRAVAVDKEELDAKPYYIVEYGSRPCVVDEKVARTLKYGPDRVILTKENFLKFISVDYKDILISLPMTGRMMEAKNEAYTTKIELSRRFRSCNFINPVEFDVDQDNVAECIGKSVETVLSIDGIVSLNGWDKSRGCKVERFVAETYGKKVYEHYQLDVRKLYNGVSGVDFEEALTNCNHNLLNPINEGKYDGKKPNDWLYYNDFKSYIERYGMERFEYWGLGNDLTGLPFEIYIDYCKSYIYKTHPLWLYFTNGIGLESNDEWIPITVSDEPQIMCNGTTYGGWEFSYDDFSKLKEFIIKYRPVLQAIANGEIEPMEFVNELQSKF